MKFSIIIVAYKAHEQILKALQSLVENPPPPHRTSKADAEIIVIDNSPEPIAAKVSNDLLIKLCQTYSQVIFEPHPENIGFAAGCNRGVELSSGENIVLMNPDTIVFPEWSERLISYVGPKVGAVGPISNFVAGWQHANLHMHMTETPEKTARYAIKGNSRRGVETKLLIGFFMLIPRRVWDAVGGMDPQFFLGCDDLDLSLRIRDAGYGLVIASDVFVYHEGHASFYASGRQAGELNKQSEKKLLAKLATKYPKGIPSSTELWGCEILPTVIGKRMTLSVCMIVRNEESNLKDLLPQLGFADEIIIANTARDYDEHPMDFVFGVAKNKRIDILHFPWGDSFSEARNFALSKCTGDYVLWLDADDRISEESAKLIRAALDFPGPLTAQKKAYFGMVIKSEVAGGFYSVADGQPRLFPRLDGMKWEGKVHESLIPAADSLDLIKVDTNIVIDHTGYRDPKVMLEKHKRNLRLSRMESDSPKKFYQMGNNLYALGEYEEARKCYATVLSDCWSAPLDPVFKNHVRHCMAALLVSASNGNPGPEIDAFLIDNPKPDSLFLRAEVALKRGRVFEAEAMYKEYCALEYVRDPYGTELEALQAVSRARLETIQNAREAVYG